jgi:hypothetical protein
MLRADVTEIVVAVNQTIPTNYDADTSALQNADVTLKQADDKVKGAEKDLRMVAQRTKQAVFGVGALALIATAFGVLAVLTRV